MSNMETMLLEVIEEAFASGVSAEQLADTIANSKIMDSVREEENRRILERLVAVGALVSVSPTKGYFYQSGDNKFTPLDKDIFASGKFIYKTSENVDE